MAGKKLNQGAQEESNTNAFSGDREYLNTLFQVETIRLLYFLRGLIIEPDGGSKNVTRFGSSSEEIRDLLTKKLNRTICAEDRKRMAGWERYLKTREQAGLKNRMFLGPQRFMEDAGLTGLGRTILIQSVMAALDADYRQVFRFLQGQGENPFPTAALCARIFFHGKKGGLEQVAYAMPAVMPAISLLYPMLTLSGSPYSESLQPDKRLLNLLLGKEGGLPDHITRYQPGMEREPLLFREELLQKLLEITSRKEPPVVHLWGERGSGKKHLLRHLWDRRGHGAVFLSCRTLHFMDRRAAPDMVEGLGLALREAVLGKEPLVVDGIDEIRKEERSHFLRWLFEEAKKRKVCLFVLEEDDSAGIGQLGETVFSLELPSLNEGQRKALWEYYGQGISFAPDVDLAQVANTFVFTPGSIRDVLKTVSCCQRTDEGPASPASAELSLVYQTCYHLADHKLGEKAKRIKSTFHWEDLKLPKEDKEQLRDICNRVKNRHIVLADWGFSQKLPYGGGVAAVFAGPPGTGKTMAAQVLANELHMEMYQIDLSQIVDKYVGETEKNIRMIFDQAKKSNSILFFDEADSLFGKRVEEAKDANSRYANIESSLLLQCMEEYSGISLLSTNNYGSMDAAFVRRFKYLIYFRMPEEDIRLEIWRSVFPEKVPLAEDVDFPWLAKNFSMTGAYIKNVALSAAFLAAEEGQPVEMLHLFKGIRREMVKEGRKLDRDQLKEFAYLYDEI